MKRTLTLIFAAMALVGCSSTHTMNGHRILIGTYGENIHELVYNSEEGTFTETALIPAVNASYLTIEGNALYAVSENGGESGAYSFVRSEGAWKQSAHVAGNGADPCYILARDGKVLTADYTGGALTAFKADDGALGEVAFRRDYPSLYEGHGPAAGGRQDAAHIHQVKVLPFDPSYLVVSDLGNDMIHVVCSADMAPVCDIEAGAGAGPRHMEFDLAHNLLFCVTELSGEVVAWKCSCGEGKPQFTEVQRIVVDEVNAGGSADIHISPDGRFLYTSHRLENDGISILSIGEDGTLTKIGYRHTGSHPRNFIITPDGSQMIVACRDTQTLEVYDIDSETGLLSEMVTCHNMPSDKPVCIIYE